MSASMPLKYRKQLIEQSDLLKSQIKGNPLHELIEMFAEELGYTYAEVQLRRTTTQVVHVVVVPSDWAWFRILFDVDPSAVTPKQILELAKKIVDERPNIATKAHMEYFYEQVEAWEPDDWESDLEWHPTDNPAHDAYDDIRAYELEIWRNI